RVLACTRSSRDAAVAVVTLRMLHANLRLRPRTCPRHVCVDASRCRGDTQQCQRCENTCDGYSCLRPGGGGYVAMWETNLYATQQRAGLTCLNSFERME